MKILVCMSSSSTDFSQAVGPYGMEGTYSTIFISSPTTAAKFVSYLKSCGVKQIFTGRRGSEYLVNWNAGPVFVDADEWRRAGFPTKYKKPKP